MSLRCVPSLSGCSRTASQAGERLTAVTPKSPLLISKPTFLPTLASLLGTGRWMLAGGNEFLQKEWRVDVVKYFPTVKPEQGHGNRPSVRLLEVSEGSRPRLPWKQTPGQGEQ